MNISNIVVFNIDIDLFIRNLEKDINVEEKLISYAKTKGYNLKHKKNINDIKKIILKNLKK